MFTVYIHIPNRIHVLHICINNYIYIYTQPATLASKYIYIANKMHTYIFINVKYWLPEPATLISKYILSATFWTFYERALAENTFPPLPSQLLHNFPLPRFKLSVCTSSRETKISGIVIFSTFCIIFVFWFCCSGFLYSNELLVGKTILWLLW